LKNFFDFIVLLVLLAACQQLSIAQRFFAYDTIRVPVGPNNALDSIIYWSTYDIADCRLSDMPQNPINFGGLFYNSNFAIDGTIFQGSYQVATVTRSDDDFADNSLIYRSALPRGVPAGRTPYAPETDGIGISADYHNRGCLVGQGVSVIDFWDRFVPLPEPVRYLGDLPERFRPGGQLMFRESSFYYPSVNDELIQLKVGQDRFWARSIGVLPDTFIYAGFFSLPHSCDSTTSYLLHHNPQGPTQLFTINLETLELTPYCEVPRKLIHAALEGENIQPPCELELDLNLADTSVHRYDTLGCAGSIPLLEGELSFGSSVVEWDSITIQLSGIRDADAETVAISGSQPNVIVHNRGSAVTLQSTGFTGHAEYLSLLRELVYTHAGALPTGGERSIELRAYHPYYGEYAATVYLYVQAQSLQVLSDISHPVCADSTGSVALNPQNGEAPYTLNWQDGETGLRRADLSAGTYPFELRDADGCRLRDSILITAPPALELRIDSPRDSICGPTGELVATATGGSGSLSLQWNDGAQTATRRGLSAGSYELVVTDSLGCTAAADYELFAVDTLFTTVRTSACAGETIVQQNTAFTRDTSFQTLQQTAAGCDSLVSYELSFLDTFATHLPYQVCAGESLTIQGVSFSRDTSFQLIETASNGCDSVLRIVITTLPPIYTSFAETICAGDSLLFGGQYRNAVGSYRDTLSATTAACDSIVELQLQIHTPATPEIMQSGAICAGNTATLATTQDFATYHWSTGSQAAQIAVQTPGSYSLTVTDEQACQATTFYRIDSVQIEVGLEIRPPDCRRETGQLFLSEPAGGQAPYLSSLNGMPLTAPYPELDPGNYTLQVVDNQGCRYDTTFAIVPAATLSVVGFPVDQTLDLGDSINLNLSTNFTPTQIRWNPPRAISCLDCLNPVITPNTTTIYQLELMDDSDCRWQGQFELRIKPTALYVPNAFSPNGDGTNDHFLAYPPERIQRMTIYDRWGAQVFVSAENSPGWDGRIKGEPAPAGVYLYVLEWRDGGAQRQLTTGEVILLR
jgi:gliding motility-associated-like protein